MRVKANLGGAPVQVVLAPVDGRMPWSLDDATLREVAFVVQEEGRQRFLDGHVNMHAWMEGEPVEYCQPGKDWVRVRYNPKLHSQFVDLYDRPVIYADLVTIRVYHGKAKTYAKGVVYADEGSDQG